MKRPSTFSIAVERGKDGYNLAWCLEMPGCAALVAPGEDATAMACAGIAEFIAWAHERSPEHADVDPSHVSITQLLETGADLSQGETTAFFLHDGQPVRGNEFPAWANAHDLALDQFRELVGSLPASAIGRGPGQASLATIQDRATNFELLVATSLGGRPKAVRPGGQGLNDAHTWLQQVICDAPPDVRLRRPVEGHVAEEEWSVRKAMRRSIWHLRYQSALVRAEVNRIWLRTGAV